MAISKNLYTRGLRQRLGGAVWYTRDGQTIVRELAAQVSNPQTLAQMEQRARMANLVAVYRANQFWMHWGAFEKKKTNWSDYNAFVSANQTVAAVYLSKSFAASGAAVVAPYIMSAGSLPRVDVVASADVLQSDIYTGDLAITDAVTIGQLSDVILANNNGLQMGDQLSIIVNIQQSTENVPYIVARAYEIILDTSDNSTLADRGLGGIVIAEERSGAAVLAIQLPSENAGGTLIISRDTAKGLQVSSSQLVITEQQQAYLDGFQNAAARAEFIRSYGSTGADNFLSAGYSGEASQGGVSLPQQILSVNGKAASEYLGSPNLYNSTLLVTMARSVQDTPTVAVKVGPTGQYVEAPAASVTVASNLITVNTAYLGSGNTQNVTGVRITTEGDELEINFSATAPEITD